LMLIMHRWLSPAVQCFLGLLLLIVGMQTFRTAHLVTEGLEWSAAIAHSSQLVGKDFVFSLIVTALFSLLGWYDSQKSKS
jgi:hypothetical protein